MTKVRVLLTRESQPNPLTIRQLASEDEGKVIALQGVVVRGGGRWWRRIRLGPQREAQQSGGVKCTRAGNFVPTVAATSSTEKRGE